MDYADQLLKNEKKLIAYKAEAFHLLSMFNNNQTKQLTLIYNMKMNRYHFEYDQIKQKEKLEHKQYEDKIDPHVAILSSVLAVELLPKVEQYVDKQDKWLKRKQHFIQKYDTVTNFRMIQMHFHSIEYNNLLQCQDLKIKHLTEFHNFHMKELNELDIFQHYQNVEKLHKQQNVEMTQLLYYQQKNNAVVMEHVKKEDELAVVISKIQVKDHLPLFDDNIDMLKNGYHSIHCKIPSLPKINRKIPLENQTIVLEEIYYQFYSLQRELIKMYPKMMDTALELNEFLKSKNIENMRTRSNWIREESRISFDD